MLKTSFARLPVEFKADVLLITRTLSLGPTLQKLPEGRGGRVENHPSGHAFDELELEGRGVEHHVCDIIRDMRKDAFIPDASNQEDISDQLAGWLRDRIASGRYKPGEKLPTMRELAETSLVSFKTARKAIERLTREGYVNARPHIGTVVMPKDITVWRGRVLLVVPEEDEASYFVNVFLGEVRRRLTAARYLTTRISVSRAPRGSCAQLKTMLGQSVDFALVMYGTPRITQLLSAAGVPYVDFSGTKAKGPRAWHFPAGDSEAKARLVDHCVRAGVKTVTEVDFGSPGTSSAAAELAEVGISVDHLAVVPRADYGRLEGIERAAYEQFVKLGRNSFPDLFIVWDDYVARGLLTAFLARGVNVPLETKVVVFANAGFAPVYPKTLTRVEHDPVQCGSDAAEFVLSVLAKGRIHSPPVMAPSYIIGETFPY